MNWLAYIADEWRDWRYIRLQRRYRALSKEIELRVYAREGITVGVDNQAESFVAFLDRRIDLLSARRDKVSAKVNRIYESWHGGCDD